MRPTARLLAAAALAAILPSAAGAQSAAQNTIAPEQSSQQPYAVGVGPNPQLPAPEHKLIPTVKVAKAVGWPAGGAPQAAEGLEVKPFAQGLDHPRWLYVLPNGDVLVAESNAPRRPKEEGSGGVRDFFEKRAMRQAGAGVASPNRIILLRDADGDGKAEVKETFLEGLNSPFGMALVGDRLYIADTDAILSFPYKEGQTRITDPPTKLTDLPAGARNHHWTKNIIASPDGKKLYATVGSNSNVGENGIDQEDGRASIWEVDIASGDSRVFATGLRNPNGLAWNPRTGQLWAAVNERDELGNDLVPDYITAVKDGGFYGWPYSYFGQHVDKRVKEQRPDLVASAIQPDYGLGSHVAALGLAFAEGASLGSEFAEGAFVGEHGSWNRDPRSGYKVVFVPFQDGKPSGPPIDVLTGFLSGDEALGRPVGVAIDKRGGLLVADDVGNAVWRVSARDRAAQAQ
jgi:glucose/arabinose dehydrogenase